MRHLIFGKKYNQTADLNNSLFINNVAQTVTMNGTVTRTTDHKGGNTAIQFGSGNLVSVDNLPASPIWSISFWMRSSQTTLEGYIISLTDDYYSNEALIAEINFQSLGSLLVGISSSPYNFKKIEGSFNDNTWRHIVIIFDRSKPANDEIKLYVNSILASITIWNSNNGDHTGNFSNNKVYIGGRTTSTQYRLNGATSPIKMFNYPLTQTEIDNLYNE